VWIRHPCAAQTVKTPQTPPKSKLNGGVQDAVRKSAKERGSEDKDVEYLRRLRAWASPRPRDQRVGKVFQAMWTVGAGAAVGPNAVAIGALLQMDVGRLI
jgi:hypothetical protein